MYHVGVTWKKAGAVKSGVQVSNLNRCQTGAPQVLCKRDKCHQTTASHATCGIGPALLNYPKPFESPVFRNIVCKG